jgi:site-specific recombinase XerD
LDETIDAYLAQIAVSLRPLSVDSAANILHRFTAVIIELDPSVAAVAEITRPHVEHYKTWLIAHGGRRGQPAANATVCQHLSTVRMCFERLIEWSWDDAPARQLIFAGDIPKRDEPLPKFLDDATFAAFLRAARAEPRPLTRLVVELLARTGMGVSELCELEADAVVLFGAAHWLRIPLGKLHNDRYIPLHPHLVELIADWQAAVAPNKCGLLLINDGQPLNRHAVGRMLNRITKRAGLPHVHPHQLRHTFATQAINRGMSLEALAALLGHRSLRMTMTYARIADRTVADEYFAVSDRVEALYDRSRHLPANAETPAMTRLRQEHRRLLGNGYCARPPQLDCAFESICEQCSYFDTGLEFHPVLLRQRDDAKTKGQDARRQLFDTILDRITDQ